MDVEVLQTRVVLGEPLPPQPGGAAPRRALGWLRRPGVVRTAWWIAVLALVGLRLLTAVHRGAAIGDGDVVRFRHLGLAHGRPYVDYSVEYPIGAFTVLRALAWLAPGRDAFGHAVVWLACVSDLVLAALLARGWGRRASLFYLAAGAPLAHLLDARIDLVAALGATAAVLAWRRARPRTAGVLLGLGAAVKLWPAALVVLLARLGRGPHGRRRLVASFAVVGGAVGVAWLALAGIGGPVQVVTFRGARGWEIESTVGVIVRLVHHGVAHVEEGAFRLGVVPRGLGIGMWAVATPVAVWAAWQGGRSRRIGAGWVGAVGVLLLASTLLSPQFLVWLLPGAAIAWAEGDRLAPLLVAAAAALTGHEMHDFAPMVNGQTGAALLVLLRNLLLLAATGLALARLARTRRPRARREVLAPLAQVAGPADVVVDLGDEVSAPA